MTKKSSKKEKKGVTDCPLCGKGMIMPKDLDAWTEEDREELTKLWKEMFPKLREIVEILNHHKLIGTNLTKRSSILSTILDFIIDYTLLTNFNRIGLLELLKNRIISQHQGQKLAKVVATMMEEANEEKKKKVNAYVA